MGWNVFLQHFEEFGKDAGIPADDFPSVQVMVAPGKVADLSTGLFHDELPGGYIPRFEAVFKEYLAPAGSHGGQVERGRA